MTNGPLKLVRARTAVWHELQRLQQRVTEGTADLVIQAGCAIGEVMAMAELLELPPARRRPVLLGLSRLVPADARLLDLAFREISEHDPTDMADLRLAVWAGLTPDEAGWEQMSLEGRAVCLEGLVKAGVPVDAFELKKFFHAQLAPEDRAALMLAWCTHRRFGKTSEEFELVAELDEAARLVTIPRILAQTHIVKPIAHTWAFDCDAAWQAASGRFEEALANARMSAIVAAAGAEAEGAQMNELALEDTSRLSDLHEVAELYSVGLGAAAVIGSKRWLEVVDELTADRRLLRSRVAFLKARAAAVRTLERAALAPPGRQNPYVESVLDRGQTALKELCRRLPEPWLDLLHRTTMAALYGALERRNIEVQIADVRDWLGREWPAPTSEITLSECLSKLAKAAPDQVLRLVDKIRGGPQGSREALQIRWLATALPYLPG